jgi:hypothetical protein
MPDSLRQRLSELEQLAYQSGDRFADAVGGAGARADRLMVRLQALEAKAQSTLVSVSTQIAKLEGKLDELRRARDQLLLQAPSGTLTTTSRTAESGHSPVR